MENFRTFSCTYSVCCDDGNSCFGNQFVQHKKSTTFPCYDIKGGGGDRGV